MSDDSVIWKKYNWDFWNPETQPLVKNPQELYPVYLVTTCMGRTRDLKICLPQNLKDNEDYPNVKFVILDYNSKDDLREFMLGSEIKPHIESGRVIFLSTRYPKHYSMSHSRNVAFKYIAESQKPEDRHRTVISNVDADNFTGKGFASYLNQLIHTQPRKCLLSKGKRLSHGRVGMLADEFLSIGGYCEDLDGYGFDEKNLMFRAMASGFKLMWWAGISPVDFTKRIKTPRKEVGQNMKNPDWKKTELGNKLKTLRQLESGQFVANLGKNWGYVPDLQKIKP